MEDETVSVRLTPDEKRLIRAAAGRRDVSMSELGQEILTDWLDEQSEQFTN